MHATVDAYAFQAELCHRHGFRWLERFYWFIAAMLQTHITSTIDPSLKPRWHKVNTDSGHEMFRRAAGGEWAHAASHKGWEP